MFDPNQMLKIHSRNAQFFGSSAKFKTFDKDLPESQYNQITDVQLQCHGYGHFRKEQILQNFFEYSLDMLKSCCQIKSLKIQINGFTLPRSRIIPKLCSYIVENIKDTIKLFWFHTNHLSNCTIEDFSTVLMLSHELSHINFEDFSMQFSRWVFAERQPTILDLEKIFRGLIESAEMQKLNNQRFRLEMSSWYYLPEHAKQFLLFKLEDIEIAKAFGLKTESKKPEYIAQKLAKIEAENIESSKSIKRLREGELTDRTKLPEEVDKFHQRMETLIKELLGVLAHVKEFEIDFRNWNELLKMKQLKKKMDNITKDNTYEKSIVSKRIGVEELQTQTELKMVFIM